MDPHTIQCALCALCIFSPHWPPTPFNVRCLRCASFLHSGLAWAMARWRSTKVTQCCLWYATCITFAGASYLGTYCGYVFLQAALADTGPWRERALAKK